ncbi:hypothetical protein B0J12DRAFT_54725 [Macrophomina phaseolina]|uniref:Uncharacterized protein n=1 Tax=Macrophomina phaseolina TaxID=35725 RepID=A0ABQ8GEJ1_9PEZI|nr:hypothetical protein B0J12DRAFT_54725 [Macrophomina phaseolina]
MPKLPPNNTSLFADCWPGRPAALRPPRCQASTARSCRNSCHHADFPRSASCDTIRLITISHVPRSISSLLSDVSDDIAVVHAPFILFPNSSPSQTALSRAPTDGNGCFVMAPNGECQILTPCDRQPGRDGEGERVTSPPCLELPTRDAGFLARAWAASSILLIRPPQYTVVARQTAVLIVASFSILSNTAHETAVQQACPVLRH